MADRDYELRDVLDTFRRDGSMIREKARVLIEEWLEKIYPRMCDVETSTSSLLDIGKALMELGDMKPKANQPVATGPAFSVTISIPQGDGKAPITIEGTASTPSPVAEAEGYGGDVVEGAALPPKPVHLLDLPVFALSEELAVD